MDANPSSLPPELGPTQPDDPPSIDRFRIVGRLGAGGMGVVYGGLDESGHCVAVKTVHEHYAAQARFREIFASEVELLARVDGVCAPRVRASDVRARVPWMATDFVPGRTLRQHVSEFGALDGAMLRAFAAGTAEALAAIHAAGVAHRDIKPGNVILAPEGPRVVDFGIATDIEASEEPDAASSYGTPGWVAPERYRGESGTAASDVFSWGGLLVLAATGRAPFGDGSPEELKERVLHEEPDLDGVPDYLRDVAAQALAKDPGARPFALSALRGLLDVTDDTAAEGDTESPAALPALGDRLRTLLTDAWHGIDAAGHHPATWATLGAASGAAASTAAAIGTLTSMAGTAPAGGGATGAASATGAAGGGASAGSGTGAAGVLAWFTGGTSGTTAAISAGAILVTGAAAGGYIGVQALAPSPQERVTSAAQLLEDGEGFTAEMTVRYTSEYAEREADANTDAQALLDASLTVHTLRYTNSDPAVFADEMVRPDGGGEEFPETVVNRAGDIYIYSTHTYGAVNREYPEPGEHAARGYSPATVAEPLRSLSEAEEITEESSDDGTAELSGPLTGHLPTSTSEVPQGGNYQESRVADEIHEETGTGTLTLDEADQPRRLEYQTDRWEVEIEFTAVNEPADIEEPTPLDEGGATVPEEFAPPGTAPGDPYGPVLMYAPTCGEFDGLDGGTWRVRADAWDVTCEEADRVAEQYLAGEGEDYMDPDFEVAPDLVTRIIEDDWLCEGAWAAEFSPTGCYPGGYTGGDPPYEYDDTAPGISFEQAF